jgi:hypothetical protein
MRDELVRFERLQRLAVRRQHREDFDRACDRAIDDVVLDDERATRSRSMISPRIFSTNVANARSAPSSRRIGVENASCIATPIS